MAIALVTNTKVTPTTTSGGTSPAVDTTGASLIVIGFSAFASLGSAVTVSDSKGNTYVPLTAKTAGKTTYAQLFYCVSPTVGSGHTFTIGGVTAGAAYIEAFSGTGAFDQQSGAAPGTSGATTIQPGSITAPAGSLFVTALSTSSSTATNSINSSFSVTDQLPGATGVYIGGAEAYKLSGTTENPTWTTSVAGDDLAAVMATFLAGATGITGSAAWTEVQDTWAGTGTVVVSGSAAWTEAQDTWAASGNVATNGVAAWTEAPDIWSGTGTVDISGSASWTEAPDIWSGTGTITLPAITGVGAWTELPDIWGGTGNNGATSAGDNFLPLTRKQEQALRKRQRAERKRREELILETRLDSEAIDQDIREALRGPQPIAEVINETIEDDDEDSDIEWLLLNA